MISNAQFKRVVDGYVSQLQRSEQRFMEDTIYWFIRVMKERGMRDNTDWEIISCLDKDSKSPEPNRDSFREIYKILKEHTDSRYYLGMHRCRFEALCAFYLYLQEFDYLVYSPVQSCFDRCR